jgi:THO complex subunit 3
MLMLPLGFVLYVGFVEVVNYPSLDVVCKLNAHTAGCYCIAMDPLDR